MADVTPSPTPDGGEQVVGEQTAALGGEAGGDEGGAPGEVAAPESQPRQRKEKLPGVVARDDANDLFPDLGFKSRTGKRVGREQAQRELEAEMQAERDGIEIPDLPEGVEVKPKEELPKTKFKFGGREFDSQEAAEQSFKSLQGMFKPLQEKVSAAEQVAEKAAESARAWRERAIQLEQQLAQPPAASTPRATDPLQRPQTSASADAKAQLDEALSNVNGELFEQLANEHGLPLAGRYLAAQVLATVNDQMLPRLRQEIMDQLMPELEPIKQDRGFQQATQHVAGLIESVGAYKYADGSLAFPELSNPDTVYQIADLWRSMEMPPELALTPKGLLQAVALYRMYNGGPTTSQNEPGGNVSRPENTAPRAASAALEGGQAPSPVRVKGEDSATRFGRELDGAELVDRTLGFAVRRRR